MTLFLFYLFFDVNNTSNPWILPFSANFSASSSPRLYGPSFKLLLSQCPGNYAPVTPSCNSPTKPYPDRLQLWNLHFHTEAGKSCWGKKNHTAMQIGAYYKGHGQSWVISGTEQYPSWPWPTSFPTALSEYSRISQLRSNFHFILSSLTFSVRNSFYFTEKNGGHQCGTPLTSLPAPLLWIYLHQ